MNCVLPVLPQHLIFRSGPFSTINTWISVISVSFGSLCSLYPFIVLGLVWKSETETENSKELCTEHSFITLFFPSIHSLVMFLLEFWREGQWVFAQWYQYASSEVLVRWLNSDWKTFSPHLYNIRIETVSDHFCNFLKFWQLTFHTYFMQRLVRCTVVTKNFSLNSNFSFWTWFLDYKCVTQCNLMMD